MLSDRPITTAKEDQLGRRHFARQIAAALRTAPAGKSSFVVGLYGEAGSGRTSLLNLTAEALIKRRKAVTIAFNPWRYPAAELVAGQFLGMLAKELQKPASGKKLRRAGKAIEAYAAALQAYTADAKSAGGKRVPLPPNVLRLKAKACKALKKQKRTLYILVDDLDPLSPERIRHTMQLFSAVADFPRTVYLLALDGQIAGQTLGENQLQKLVQLQIPVPAAEAGKVHAILDAYIEDWRKKHADLNFDPVYFAEIKPFLYACIPGLRGVNRFVNTFTFQYQALGNEVNFVDLLVITALRLHVPQAIAWMQAHRDDLLRGGGLAFSGAGNEERQRLKRDHRRSIAALCETCEKTLPSLLGHLFPRYGRNVLDIYNEESDLRTVRMRRICCEEFFDLYFTLAPETLLVTRREILRSIRSMDAAALRRYTDGLTDAKRRTLYVTQLRYYLGEIPDAKLPMFFAELLWLSRLPESKSLTEQPSQQSFFGACCACGLRMLSEMSAPMRSQCLARAAGEANEHTLPMLVTILNRIANRDPEAETITLPGAEAAAYRAKALRAIHAFAETGNWLRMPHPLPVLEFWKQADAASFQPYFQHILRDDCNVARLISSLTHRFDQGASMEYQYGDQNGLHAFSDDFTRGEALSAIVRLQNTAAFAELPEDVRLDCVAFSLMDEQITRVQHRVVLDAYPAWDNE